MYLRFLELHDVDILNDDAEYALISVNAENICGFHRYCDDKNKTVIGLADRTIHVVSESYDDVKRMMHDVGCLIHKDDPRLDTTTPLTMKDLQNMIGEPVWNSNNRSWALVTENSEYHGEEQQGYYLRYHDDSITRFDAEDLRKFPLYRMRRD